MILIKNRQRKIKINTKELERIATKMLEFLDYKNFDLGILLTTNSAIRTLNREYRGKDKATDILSFSHHPSLKAGKRIKVLSDDDKNLGDLILSVEYVQKDAAKTWGRSLPEHLHYLLAHGIAHLLGYDHITDAEYKVMHALELKLVKNSK